MVTGRHWKNLTFMQIDNFRVAVYNALQSYEKQHGRMAKYVVVADEDKYDAIDNLFDGVKVLMTRVKIKGFLLLHVLVGDDIISQIVKRENMQIEEPLPNDFILPTSEGTIDE